MGARYPANRPLRHQRRLRGWSLEDVADRLHREAVTAGEPTLGCDANSVSRWERGVRMPGPRYTRLLCRLYELPVDRLGLIPTIDVGGWSDRAASSDMDSLTNDADPQRLHMGREADGTSHLAAIRTFRDVDPIVGGGCLYRTVVGYLRSEIAPQIIGDTLCTDRQLVFNAAAFTEMARRAPSGRVTALSPLPGSVPSTRGHSQPRRRDACSNWARWKPPRVRLGEWSPFARATDGGVEPLARSWSRQRSSPKDSPTKPAPSGTRLSM